jgi:hypothetical protein
MLSGTEKAQSKNRPLFRMPPKKRPASATLSPKKLQATDEQYLVITVALDEGLEVETFVVPMSALGDDRWDVEDMLKFGLKSEEAVFFDDNEKPPAPGMPTLLRRLGLKLGLLAPSDEPDRADERLICKTLAKTRLSKTVSYCGPSIGVIGMRIETD